jgi:hypothetical protein
MARDAPAEFEPLFHAAMVGKDARPTLDAFIKSLSAGEADACISAYFKASSDPTRSYSRSDKQSLGVFAALALAALDRGDPLYAVRFEALVLAAGTAWQERFNALEPAQQKKLSTRATQRIKGLSPSQRQFLTLYHQSIRTGHTGPVEKFIDKLEFREAHACLLAYMEASLRYTPEHERSLLVFYGVSILVIRKGDGDFVRQYRKLVATTGSLWQLRWVALNPHFRNELEKELAAKALKANLIAGGHGKNAMPVSVTTPPPDRLRADATRSDVPSSSTVKRKFLVLFAKFMSPNGGAKAKHTAVTEFIFAQKPLALRDCLAAYLEASEQYPDDSVPSLYIFWGITSRLVNLGTAYEALKLDWLINTPGTLVAKRFIALAADGERKTLAKEIELKLLKRHILDDLKLAYYKIHHADADLASLRRFEPEVDPSVREAVRSAAMDCDRTFGQRDKEAFKTTFAAWAKLMHAQTDTLVHLAMLKWCRQAIEITALLRSELYWCGVLALQINARTRYPEVYDRGLGAEEKEFLLDPKLVTQVYRFDFERRLELVFWKRVSPAQLLEVAEAHVMLLYLAQKMGFILVAMDEAKDIHDKLHRLGTKKPKSRDDIRIPIASRGSAQKLALGDTVGKLWIIWWDRKHSHVFVEMEGCGRVLFRLDSYLTLGRLKYEDATYGQIWRNTEHLLVVISGFYRLMGYLPDLVSGGFAGLVTSVVTDLMVDAVAEQAGLGPNATMVLSMGAHMLSGRLLEGARETSGAHVLLDSSDVDEIAAGASRGTTHATDAPVASHGPDRSGTVVPEAPKQHGGPHPQKEAVSPTARATQPSQKLLAAPKFTPSELDTAISVGLEPDQVRAIAGLLGKKFDGSQMNEFAAIWKRVRTRHTQSIEEVQRMFAPGVATQEIKDRAREVFGQIRDDFWQQIRHGTDAKSIAARDRLEQAGIRFLGDANAPVLTVKTSQGWSNVEVHVDHVAELGQQPMKAFSSNNFQLSLRDENTILLNQLHTRDPFLPDVRKTAGRGTSRAGKLLGKPSTPTAGVSAADDAQAAIEGQLERLSNLPAELDSF